MPELFDRRAVKRWRRICHKEIDWMAGVTCDEAFRQAGLVMMSVYAFGTDIDTLVALTGQTSTVVRDVLKRLRAQRILSGQTLRVNWNDDESGFVAAVCDLLVAVGQVVRPVDPVRSAALKGKAGRKRGGVNRPKAALLSGAVYTPKVQAVPKQLYKISPAGRASVEAMKAELCP